MPFHRILGGFYDCNIFVTQFCLVLFITMINKEILIFQKCNYFDTNGIEIQGRGFVSLSGIMNRGIKGSWAMGSVANFNENRRSATIAWSIRSVWTIVESNYAGNWKHLLLGVVTVTMSVFTHIWTPRLLQDKSSF